MFTFYYWPGSKEAHSVYEIIMAIIFSGVAIGGLFYEIFLGGKKNGSSV